MNTQKRCSLASGPDLRVIEDFPFCLVAYHRAVPLLKISRGAQQALFLHAGGGMDR